MADSPGDVTQLLSRVRAGDARAESDLFALLQSELHRIARRHMKKERVDHTLQATALVNEAYVKLAKQQIDWKDRAHFVAVASRAMRQILVDHARRRFAEKREGGQRIDLAQAGAFFETKPEKMLTLDQALSRLSEWDSRQSQIVEMRFFGGMTEEDIAEVLGISSRTVKREWSMARAWLEDQLDTHAYG